MQTDQTFVPPDGTASQLLDDVRELMVASLRSTALQAILADLGPIAGGGKMLRARLVLRLGAVTGISLDTRTRVAAAVEMIHAASLCHDDVLDGSTTRRGMPALWVKKGMKGAVLVGDLLVCWSLDLLKNGPANLIPALVESAGEMCEAEAEQELMPRGANDSWEASVSLARRKTGALFATAAYACGGADPELSEALREAGYDIGTAYQLADDLLDAYGDPADSDKPLRNDAATQKITGASSWRVSDVDPVERIDWIRERSREHLAPWPHVLQGWDAYLHADIGPTLNAWSATFEQEATA